MKLHTNETLFQDFVSLVSQEEDIDETIVVKDYYVVLALKKLYEQNDNLVFIGGTLPHLLQLSVLMKVMYVAIK